MRGVLRQGPVRLVDGQPAGCLADFLPLSIRALRRRQDNVLRQHEVLDNNGLVHGLTLCHQADRIQQGIPNTVVNCHIQWGLTFAVSCLNKEKLTLIFLPKHAFYLL